MSDAKVKDPKTVTIIVNTRDQIVEKGKITFDSVVALAFPDPPTGENVAFTVLYRRGHGNHEGSLVPGGSVEVVDGMIFNVTPTDRS